MTAETRVIPVKPDDVAEVLRWCALGPDRMPHQNFTRGVHITNAAGRVANDWKILAPDLAADVMRKLAERVLSGDIDPNYHPDHPKLGIRGEVLDGPSIEMKVETIIQWERDHWVVQARGYTATGSGATRSEALEDLKRKLNI